MADEDGAECGSRHQSFGIRTGHPQLSDDHQAWQQDTSTIYETTVATATISTASSVAQSLAAQGYIITATGSDRSSDGSDVVLIGTRVKGDTMPRPVMVVPLAQLNTGLPQMFQRGYAVVGVAIQRDFVSSTVAVEDWIGER